MTGSIRFLQHSILNNISHGYERKKFKVEAIKLIHYRMKMVTKLRETDYKQYEWLLERLDLQYKPKPTKEDEIMIARKEGLRQLTQAYCDDIRKHRLEVYRIELEAQQVPFLEQKIKNLEYIRNEQFQLKVPVTITQTQIDEVRKQYDHLKIEHDSRKEQPTKRKWKMY